MASNIENIEDSVSSFDFNTLLENTQKITFTPEYKGNKFVPLVQKYSLDSNEKETQRISLSLTYKQFLDLTAKKFYTALTGNNVDDEDTPYTGTTEEDNKNIDYVTVDKLKALLTNDTSVYPNSVITSMKLKVLDNENLYNEFVRSKAAFKRKLIYSKAFSMIKHRSLKPVNLGDLKFKDFLNQDVIPYPIVYIISMFYDAEERMEEPEPFKISMLEDVDITDA